MRMEKPMTTRTRSTARAAAGLLVTAAALTACSDSSADPQDSPTNPTKPSSSTSTKTNISPEQQNLRSATKAVKRFNETRDRLTKDRSAPVSEIDKVAKGKLARNWSAWIPRDRKAGLKYSGDTAVEAPKATYEGQNHYAVRACIDVSDVKVVDKKGKNKVSKNRRDRSPYQYRVEQDSSQAWWVTDEVQLEGKC